MVDYVVVLELRFLIASSSLLHLSKSEYGVRNALTQLHISLHNEIYSINGVIYFLFVHRKWNRIGAILLHFTFIPF